MTKVVGYNEPIAIVLGGTVPHKALINNLRNRGYRTILVDYHDTPPAARAADAHIRASTLDQEAVLETARREHASLVISGCVDQANVTACYVAEKLGLPRPYSYETALKVTDKDLMKAGMFRGGVPTAEYHVVSSSDAEHLLFDNYPLVVKPADSNGSKGVRKVGNQQELTRAVREACIFSRTGRAIVESFNKGPEINSYCYVSDEQVHQIYAKRKRHPRLGGEMSLQSFISIGPEHLSPAAESRLMDAVKGIAREFSLQNTPLLVQANVTEDSVQVIEFAPRVGGGLAFREIAIQTGFDMIDAVICSYLGEAVDTASVSLSDMMISVIHLYGQGGILSRVEGMEDLLRAQVVEEFHLHKTPGMLMGGDLASRNRVLGAILRGESLEELQAKTRVMIDRLRIMSTEQVDVLDRSVFSGILT